MGRTAATLGFSVPPELKNEVEKLAKEEGKTKSELFREMYRVYKQVQEEQEFFTIQRSVARKAREKRVYTEKDIERIVYEGR